MTVTPLIGITGRRRQGGDLARLLPFQGELDIDVYFASYGRQVAAAGGIPVLIPRDGGPEVASRRDGLVLSGGADIDPALYAPDEDPSLSKVEPGRGMLLSGLGQQLLGVNARLLDPLVELSQPATHQARGDLGVELGAEASPRPESLDTVFVAGQFHRTVGEGESVHVPLEPGAIEKSVRALRLRGVPTALRAMGRFHGAAKGR